MHTTELAYGGGLNPSDGFPVFFTEVSGQLGRYDTTRADAGRISQIFPPETYPKVIDICCGLGRISKSLHDIGYDVQGLDLSEQQINLAKEQNPGPTYVVGDMASPPGENFDIITNMYTSFGYYSSEAEDISLFKKWCSLLRPGGVLIMELADMERARNRIPGNGELVRRNGDVEEFLTIDWESRILTVDYRSAGRSWLCKTRLYEKEFLRSSLLEAGFETVDLYGSLEFTEKLPDDNLIIVARK
jgi:SAM-dependent methyltransferase